ncbi:hypothetical protein J3L16_06590 [Alteromonas sp. 5E99-2]|uniref:hypothetical protein n=1 Tax=Alteromonas sp. 5E99-2 TaxID=2817683 RepID=UPI001A992EB4|nr:hypothetical protein [Alteromonas sp. 5E99-2]MBO1255349.1 hypothetical protein [Alteromonas sp. 5E99-2]
MGVIVYELNEIPQKVFDFYALSHPNSAFAKLRQQSALFQTHTADVGSLSPWVTWPTMHRGVSNIEHEISDLGQDLSRVNGEFPNIYTLLAQQGVKVGVFGSLQSYPLPDNLDNFAFYVPDTFAAGDECFPEALSAFQRFNLSMVQANGRNVSSGIAVKDAARFIQKSISLGLTSNTFLKLSNQIVSERFNSDRVVRRRTSQAEIAFDLYFRQLATTRPDVSFFFTNHLASSMHRYWPTIFPEDYEAGKFDESWRLQWSGEIPHAVKVANYQLQKLLDYCDKTGSELIVSSSMGQGAVTNVEPVETQVLITNLTRLMNYLGVNRADWEPRLSMAPRVTVSPKSGTVKQQLNKLKNITINGQHITVFETSTGDLRLDVNIHNQDSLAVYDNDLNIEPKLIGIDNVHLQDASGSYAYHIPEGVLLHYTPCQIASNHIMSEQEAKVWEPVSVLDFAPSLLSKFNKPIPSYMEKENLFLS